MAIETRQEGGKLPSLPSALPSPLLDSVSCFSLVGCLSACPSVSDTLTLSQVKVCGKVPTGLPPLEAPKNFNANFGLLFTKAIPIVIIGFLETLSIENHFAIRRKYQVMRLD